MNTLNINNTKVFASLKVCEEFKEISKFYRSFFVPIEIIRVSSQMLENSLLSKEFNERFFSDSLGLLDFMIVCNNIEALIPDYCAVLDPKNPRYQNIFLEQNKEIGLWKNDGYSLFAIAKQFNEYKYIYPKLQSGKIFNASFTRFLEKKRGLMVGKAKKISI